MNETRQLIDYLKQKNGFRFDRDIASALGVDPTYLSHSVRLNRPPWTQIESTFPSLMVELKQFFEKQRQEARNNQEEQKVAGFRSEYRQVPEYNVRVSAGPGMFQDSEHIKGQVQIARQWLPTNGKLGLVQVEGDSMFPTINHGDLVAVEFETGYTSDGLYLIRVEDSSYVKRLQREFGSIRIISDNPQYREMTVSPNDGNDFGLIGRVCLIIRKT